MKRLFAVMVLVALVAGCKPGHPVNVYVGDKFDDTDQAGARLVEKIAVLDCASSLSQAEDSDHLAPRTMARYLEPALQTRTDYKFIAPTTVNYAVEKTGSAEAYAKFLRSYAMTDKPDMAFLAAVVYTVAHAFIANSEGTGSARARTVWRGSCVNKASRPMWRRFVTPCHT